MRIFRSMATSASGMSAERLRLDLIANNIANVYTTRTESGGPYRRKVAVFAEALEQARSARFSGSGVKVAAVVEDDSPPKVVYDPTHPDANAEGFVQMPNVNPVNELVDMMTATRAYEANVTVFNAGKTMALKALEIGRG